MKTSLAGLLLLCLVLLGLSGPARAETPKVSPDCPCAGSINRLVQAYESRPEFKTLLDAAFANMQQLPPDYPRGNPWIGKDLGYLVRFLESWCTFLPQVNGSHDDGLKYIQDFAWFYYQNPFGRVFVRLPPGKGIMQQFVRERGAYMDSPASLKFVEQWINDPRGEKEDYALPDPSAKDGGYKSFNEFFARELKNQAVSRPQTMPGRDYLIAAPTDCIMNSVPQKITSLDTPITTKGGEALNILEMLGGSMYAKKFVGGTALSCVLMPNTYHHFHAPVKGRVVEAQILGGSFFGHPNFPKWAPSTGNVGFPGANFNPFGGFQRAYFVIDTGQYGHVAMVAVGLNTISSITLEPAFSHLSAPVAVERGRKLGHFLYGGSLCLMFFEKGRYTSGAVKVRLGNQIGIFDTPR
ncbi:MAG: phosphatidylserine decarboxylase [Desulfarculaceae bacterium]|nr:phosphatidylserine decarboxylase [Desulfarculaceae bacterium]